MAAIAVQGIMHGIHIKLSLKMTLALDIQVYVLTYIFNFHCMLKAKSTLAWLRLSHMILSLSSHSPLSFIYEH